jgi:hypothetical protein
MQSFADNIVELAVKALEIRGHGDITKVVEDAEDEGLYDGIEVVKYDDNRVVVGGWIDFQFSEVRNVIVVSLYGPGNSNTLRFTATVSPTSGYCGIRSDNEIKCELLRLGDAWTYEPYEAFDVTMPNGTTENYGRIARSSVTWDSEFEVFTLTSDVEESATRSEDISSIRFLMDCSSMPKTKLLMPGIRLCGSSVLIWFLSEE